MRVCLLTNAHIIIVLKHFFTIILKYAQLLTYVKIAKSALIVSFLSQP